LSGFRWCGIRSHMSGICGGGSLATWLPLSHGARACPRPSAIISQAGGSPPPPPACYSPSSRRR
jgi:hypothetical protein